MRRAKITIIGAGNVGATTAHWCAAAELGDVVLLDIPQTEGMPRRQSARSDGGLANRRLRLESGRHDRLRRHSRQRHRRNHRGHPPQARHEPRRSAQKPTPKSWAAFSEQVKATSPDAFVIVVSNPLDAMVQRALQVTGFPKPPRHGPGRRARHRAVPGLLGDGARCERRRRACDAPWADMAIRWCRYESCTSVGGVPVSQLIDADRLEEIIERTRKGGGEIVGLLKTGSAYYAPAAASAQMVEAIVRDKKRLLPAAAYCDKEYGVGGFYVGVPVILGAGGIEKIVELDLTDSEQAEFDKQRRRGQRTGRDDGNPDRVEFPPSLK